MLHTDGNSMCSIEYAIMSFAHQAVALCGWLNCDISQPTSDLLDAQWNNVFHLKRRFSLTFKAVGVIQVFYAITGIFCAFDLQET